MHMRLESFKHAQNHGINAGKNIIGKRTAYTEIPWMWSDQYDLNIQLSGVIHDYDACVSRGSSLVDGILYFYLNSYFHFQRSGMDCQMLKFVIVSVTWI